MLEKVKLELPEEEMKDILEECDDTLRNPPNAVRHIVREYFKDKAMNNESGEEVRANDD